MKEIELLLEITTKLRAKYQRRFTLDGKLVGDIGEVLAAEKYGLFLYEENTKIHDGEEISTKRKVQIKSSFKGYSYFPYSEVPDYFLSLIIHENGELEELFNGPGKFIVDHYIKARKIQPYKNSYYTLSRGVLEMLNAKVPLAEKIQKVKI